MAGNRPASHSSEAPARDNLTRRLTPRRSKMHGVMQASTLTARTVRTRTFAASSLGKISSALWRDAANGSILPRRTGSENASTEGRASDDAASPAHDVHA